MASLITYNGSAADPQADPVAAAWQRMADEVRDSFGRGATREALAEEFARVIYEGFEAVDLVNLFTNVHRLNKGDELTFKEVRGLKMHWIARGGQVDSSTIERKTWRMESDLVGFAVDELVENFTAGFATSAPELIDLAISQLSAEVNRRVLALWQFVIDENSEFYHEDDGLDLGWLRRTLTSVKDKTSGQAGHRAGNVAIVGRATVTDQIMDLIEDDQAFLPETNEAIRQRGYLGTYRGARIVELQSFEDADGVPRIPANELFITAGDNTEVAYFGGMAVQEEIQRWYWHFEGQREVGFALRKADRLRRFVDTSIDPDDGSDVTSV